MLKLLFLLLPWAFAHQLNWCAPGANQGQMCFAAVRTLRPTQFAAGFIDVEAKTLEYQAKAAAGQLHQYISDHPVDVVIGPGGEVFVIDGHHYAMAMDRLGVEVISATVLRDWSGLRWDEFWVQMREMKWFFPYRWDEGPLDPKQLPRDLLDIVDDPYRTLAAMVRKAGGYQKSHMSFSEFEWAGFFRSRLVLAGDNWAEAVTEGVALAKSAAARLLPGWQGGDCAKDLRP